jgi:hypothetical protein
MAEAPFAPPFTASRPTAAIELVKVATSFRNHLNCGTVGTVMRGGGIGATLEAFPIPLGSADILPNAPSSAAFGRPPTVPTAADPECPAAAEPPPPRANEAAEVAKTRNNAMANFVVVFDMGSSVHYRPRMSS